MVKSMSRIVPNITARATYQCTGGDFEVEAAPERRRGRRWYVITARRFRPGTLATVWGCEVFATTDPRESNARLADVLRVARALAGIEVAS